MESEISEADSVQAPEIDPLTGQIQDPPPKPRSKHLSKKYFTPLGSQREAKRKDVLEEYYLLVRN